MKLTKLTRKMTQSPPKTLRTLTADESRQIGGGALDALLIINRLGARNAKQDQMSNFEIQRKMQIMN